MKFRKNTEFALNGNGQYGTIVIAVIFAAILTSLVLFIAGTVDGLTEQYGKLFAHLEVIISIFFLIEYIARLWSAPNRIKYAFSFWGIIDFLAMLPILAFVGGDLSVLKSLRLLRMAQIFKILRLGDAHEHLANAFNQVKRELSVFIVLALVMVIFGAIGIYFFERNAQPEHFSSVPSSIWWAVATLTTVGYGDVYPITVGGRIFTGLLLLVGLAIVAVPTGLFSAALISAQKQISSDDEQ